MDKYIYNENNGLWYERCGDYSLPCLVLPEQKSVGKWGRKYRAYLWKYKREVYNAFQSDGTLDEHITEINQQAEERYVPPPVTHLNNWVLQNTQSDPLKLSRLKCLPCDRLL